MIQLSLLTSDGHKVTQIQVPPFQILPTVVVWGDRFFLHGSRASSGNEGETSHNYYETFGYVAPVTA